MEKQSQKDRNVNAQIIGALQDMEIVVSSSMVIPQQVTRMGFYDQGGDLLGTLSIMFL